MTATLLGMRGFDMGHSMLNTADLSSATGVVASATYAHTGTYSLRFGGATPNWGRWRMSGNPTRPSMSAWVYLRYTYNFSGTGTAYSNIRFRLVDGTFVELRWNSDTHTYDAYVNGLLFQAGTIEVSNNTWFHVQFYATIAEAASGGNITVLIDGHESINKDGDTLSGVTAETDYLYIHSGAGGAGGNFDYIDDLIWGCDGLLGDRRVYEKRPTSDTALTEWTPSTGVDNYAMEDETPPNDADYNQAAAIWYYNRRQQDEMTLSALDVTGKTCTGVVAWVRAKMTDGVGDSIDVGIDSNGTDSVATSALSTSWEYYWGNVEEVDPADSAAWTQGKLDALLSRKVAVIT